MTYNTPKPKQPKETAYEVGDKKVLVNNQDLINPARAKKVLFLQQIKDKGEITEGELLLIKRRLNDKTYSIKDIDGFYDIKLTPEQQEKGRKWLVNQWKGKSGVERKNNPFGYREQNVLDNFKEIRLYDWNDTANYYQSQAGIKNYQPVYRVIGKDENTFEYYVNGGEISITG